MARLTLKIAATAASLISSASAAATSGDFNVLSMNVAGLPEILQSNDVPGDKATNAGTIGTLFAKYDYDIIHAQEGQAYPPLVNFTTRHLLNLTSKQASKLKRLT